MVTEAVHAKQPTAPGRPRPDAILACVLDAIGTASGRGRTQLQAELRDAHPDMPVNPDETARALAVIGGALGIELRANDREVRASMYYIMDLVDLVRRRVDQR